MNRVNNPENLRRWLDAKGGVLSAQANLNKATVEMGNAENALGKEVLPNDAKVGETFCIPVSVVNPAKAGGDSITRYLHVSRRSPHSSDYNVRWREGNDEH